LRLQHKKVQKKGRPEAKDDADVHPSLLAHRLRDRKRRALMRALRMAGKVEPVFVPAIDDLPQAILDQARDGDVVLCMGAGSIGLVAGKVIERSGARA
jgi:UDP-N-acetylmuramate-alanine ligase